jgi:hypothetical protein
LFEAERPPDDFKDPGNGLLISLQPSPEPPPVDPPMRLQEIGMEGVANPHDTVKAFLPHHPAAVEGKGEDVQALRMRYDRYPAKVKSAISFGEGRRVDVHFQPFVGEEMHEVVAIRLRAAFFRQEFPYAEGDLHAGGTTFKIF